MILDLNLPGISDSEVANALEKSGVLPETPLIVATSLSEDARSTPPYSEPSLYFQSLST